MLSNNYSQLNDYLQLPHKSGCKITAFFDNHQIFLQKKSKNNYFSDIYPKKIHYLCNHITNQL